MTKIGQTGSSEKSIARVRIFINASGSRLMKLKQSSDPKQSSHAINY